MKTTYSILCLILSALFTGCGVQRQPAPAKTFFMLTIEPHTPPAPISSDSCLRVRPVTVRSPFSGTALIYRTSPSAWEKDYYNQFLTAPDRQLDDRLAEWLCAASVSLCPDGLTGDPQRLTLEPHLEALYADFRTPAKPAAYAKFRFVLTRYDRSCRCGSILLDETLEAAVPLPANPDAEAVVAALSQAVLEILETFHLALQNAL